MCVDEQRMKKCNNTISHYHAGDSNKSISMTYDYIFATIPSKSMHNNRLLGDYSLYNLIIFSDDAFIRWEGNSAVLQSVISFPKEKFSVKSKNN